MHGSLHSDGPAARLPADGGSASRGPGIRRAALAAEGIRFMLLAFDDRGIGTLEIEKPDGEVVSYKLALAPRGLSR